MKLIGNQVSSRTRGIFIAAATALSAISATEAAAEVVWLEKEYDFGLMKEEAGPRTGSVRLVNTGPEEIVITGARPSCGCTAVAYPEDPIAPGDTVKFSFTYNPIGRPGKFAKSIRVYIGDYDMATIRIRGNVLGTPESLSSLYPIEAGALRLSSDTMSGGDVTYGATRHFFLNGYNQSSDTIRPTWRCDDPSLSISSSAEEAGPGDIITFSFYFNSRQKQDMGPVSIPVTIFSGSENGERKREVVFSANVVPDFSRMTPDQVKNAPRCYLTPPLIDLGTLGPKQKGGKAEIRFAVRNDGKSDMRVIRIFSTSASVRMSRWPSSVKPGKSGSAQGTLDVSTLPAGPFRIAIEVLTDDPLHPSRTINVTGIRE